MEGPTGQRNAFQLLTALLLCASFLASAAVAQNQGLVVRDGSLGAGAPGIVAPGIDDLGRPADYLIRADLGEQRGGNLFHSFEQFSIDTGETATFTGQGLPADRPAIDHVISRVTGTDESQIDGTLRSTIDGADVWLMNPNGVVFGENGRLDVPAGFHASTAHSLGFGTESFEARAGGEVPILAVDPPEAFGFLGTNTAAIRVDAGAVLDVGGGDSLSLDSAGEITVAGYLYASGDNGGDIAVRGGTVAVSGGLNASGFDAIGGRVLLEGQDRVAVAGYVQAFGTAVGGDITIGTPTTGAGEVTIEGRLSASGATGGHIEVRGGTVAVTGGLFGDISAGRGGSVLLEGRDDVTVASSVGGGDITVLGGTVAVTGGVYAEDHSGRGGSVLFEGQDGVMVAGFVHADGFAGGGDITIHAPTGTVALERRSSVTADASPSSYGDGGDILLEGQWLRLGGRLSVAGSRTGTPGTITLIGEPDAKNQGGVVRDGSLGEDPAGVVPVGSDGGLFSDYVITPELGKLVGHNLFHSFSRFDVAFTEIATFTGPEGLQSIVARVTGNDLSEISGTVRTTAPDADLYLLNPAGIVFGSGAYLDVAGGFHASTADRLEFTQGERFEARLDGAVPALAMVLPTEFGFLDSNTAPIRLDRSVFLEPRADLSLEGAGAVTVAGDLWSGGDMAVRGGTVAVTGRVTNYSGSGGSVLLEGQTGVTISGPVLTGLFGEGGGNLTILGGSVTLDGSTVSVENRDGSSAGTVRIEAEDQVLINGSQILAWAQGTGGGQGGAIDISSNGDVTIWNSELLAAATGTGGAISISCGAETCANRLVMRDGAVLDAGGFGGSFGKGGSIEIHVGTLDLDGGSMMAASGFFGAAGSIDIHGDVAVQIANTGGGPVDFNDLLELGGTVPGIVAPSLAWQGGTIVIEAPRVVVEEGAAVWVQSGLLGGGGSILLQGDVIEVLSGAAVDGSSLFGNGGSIEILGGTSVAISGGGEEGPSRVRALGAGGGNGGSILVSAPQIALDGGAIATSSTDQAGTGRAGASGAITLIGDEIALSGGARVDTSTFTPGDGGAIYLSAPVITIEGEGTRVSARAGGEGRGGQVTIEAGDLTVRDGATIGAESRAGFAELDAVFGDALRLAEAVLRYLFPGRNPQDPPLVAQGAGGLVEVSADRVLLESDGSIVASTSGPGAGGDVVVDTALLELTSGSSISAESAGTGDAGSVRVIADELHAQGKSKISVKADLADGGDVILTAADRVHLVDSAISADVGDGKGGNITIDPAFVILDHSDIVARAGAGTGGEITIVADALIRDPASLISASAGNPALSGTVNIHAPDVDLAGSLAALPESALDASDQLAEQCSARRHGETEGSFTVAGATLRPGPQGWLVAWSDEVDRTGAATEAPPLGASLLSAGRCQ